MIEKISGLKSSKQAPIGWHTLRRSLATLLISNGENVKVTQSQLRHTTPTLTLGLYSQAVSADQQRAHAKVVRMVRPKARSKKKLKAKNPNFRAIEKAGIFIPAPYGVLWRLKLAYQIWRKFFRILVSALGLEPRTHALKGRCSTN